jgi:dTDP-4-amino-4,6-dideoxygalactose transaminase
MEPSGKPYIPHSRPALGDREAAAVAEVMASGQIALGPRAARLEAATARAVGLSVDSSPSPPAVAVSSGTAALLVALRALGIGPGDEVLIPAYACASLNQAVRYCGASPRFFDSDPATLNPDADDARRRRGPRSAACIVPHMFGRPADMAAFRALDLPLVEDCAQTLGVRSGHRLVGSLGDVSVCSFYATKLVAGGEGGMVLSSQRALVDRARALRDCEGERVDEDAFNFKMTDIHAAVAEVQLQRLGEFLARRAQLAARYRAALQGAAVDLPEPATEHAWFRYVVRLREEDLDALLARAEDAHLGCRRPVGRLAATVDLSRLPGCREAWDKACSVPLYPGLSDDEAADVARRFSELLAAAR